MKREIKFRAWDGERLHYNVVPWRWDFVISLSWHRCERSTGSGFLGSGGKDGDFLVPAIRFKEIMQYTGLKDKNGKEIYEGDVVMINHWKSSDLFDYSNPFEVTWRDGQIDFVQGEYHNFIGSLNGKIEIEVIGNIYENPTL